MRSVKNKGKLASQLSLEKIADLSDEEVSEIRELFPKMSDIELRRFISALDGSIDQILDSYFKLPESEL